jgi:Fe2+ transport system protein FeoA
MDLRKRIEAFGIVRGTPIVGGASWLLTATVTIRRSIPALLSLLFIGVSYNL